MTTDGRVLVWDVTHMFCCETLIGCSTLASCWFLLSLAVKVTHGFQATTPLTGPLFNSEILTFCCTFSQVCANRVIEFKL